MSAVHVAVVSRDAHERDAIAAAFDAAPSDWDVRLYEREPDEADVVVYGPDAYKGAGLRFDPARPHSVIDEAQRALSSSRSRCIVVTSASGGNGATTVALHLAQSAAVSGPCGFVDLDVCWGCADRLGIDGAAARTWGEIDRSETSIDLIAHPVAGGFRALLAPRDDDVGDATHVLDAACARFACVVVDAPRGPLLRQAIDRADVVVVLASASMTGVRRAASFVESLPIDTPGAVVLNRLGRGGEATRAELQRQLGHPIALELPCCAALRDAEDEGRLLTSPLFRWRRAVTRLAGALAG